MIDEVAYWSGSIPTTSPHLFDLSISTNFLDYCCFDNVTQFAMKGQEIRRQTGDPATGDPATGYLFPMRRPTSD
jgi:hypothetical protein